jgi:hypothetical protein
VYLDEKMFTFSTFREKGWAHKRDTIRVNDSKFRVASLAVIAAISEEVWFHRFHCASENDQNRVFHYIHQLDR